MGAIGKAKDRAETIDVTVNQVDRPYKSRRDCSMDGFAVEKYDRKHMPESRSLEKVFEKMQS